MAQKSKQAADFIVPLNINGLDGRLLAMPAPKAHKNREILVVYGHHSSLERWWGFAQALNRYGAVTMPDLPGFGGMDSFYNIGKKPNLDNMADYLASFIKWRYKRKPVAIVALSYGFLVATRMLQRYPELTKKVEFLVSAVGFSHYDDFKFSKARMRWYRIGTQIVATPPIAFAFRYLALNEWILRKAYHKTFTAKDKFIGADAEMTEKLMDTEVVLWHANDVRTHMFTTHDMLTVDNCQRRIDLPIWHVSAAADQYFDAYRVEQHLRIIFSEYHECKNKSMRHTPSVVADAKEAAVLIPPELRRQLLAKPR